MRMILMYLKSHMMLRHSGWILSWRTETAACTQSISSSLAETFVPIEPFAPILISLPVVDQVLMSLMKFRLNVVMSYLAPCIGVTKSHK